MQRLSIGLGANLGKPEQTIQLALQRLEAWGNLSLLASLIAQTQTTTVPPDVLLSQLNFKASSLYLSGPVDAPGPNYINAVAQFNSLLNGPDILHALQTIEAEFGRERSVRNAPRTLDLDLLLIGDQHLNLPNLMVPHPRLTERAFVLKPLTELDASLLIHGKAVGEYLAQCTDQRCTLLPRS